MIFFSYIMDVANIRPLVWVRVDALGHQLPQTLAVLVRGQGRIVALQFLVLTFFQMYFSSIYLLYFLAQRIKIHLVPVEWRLEGCHLIEETSKRPNVGLEIVSMFMNPLW